MSGLPPKADVQWTRSDVRSGPEGDVATIRALAGHIGEPPAMLARADEVIE